MYIKMRTFLEKYAKNTCLEMCAAERHKTQLLLDQPLPVPQTARRQCMNFFLLDGYGQLTQTMWLVEWNHQIVKSYNQAEVGLNNSYWPSGIIGEPHSWPMDYLGQATVESALAWA